MDRVLILGGTAEARALAGALVDAGVGVTSSLAGRVSAPLLPPGDVRIGDFEDGAALAALIDAEGVGAVVDATHPFARAISELAATACASRGVPLTRLQRPGWTERPGDRWHRVADLAAAARAIDDLGRRVLLTTGRRGLAAFADARDTWFLIRSISPPDPPLPARHRLLLARGPHALEDELALIDRHRIDVVVTKDSGGEATSAKLDAARARGLPVVVVDRPALPDVPTAATVADAIRLLSERGAAQPEGAGQAGRAGGGRKA